MTALPAAPTLTLRHGAAIPQLGLGTWPLDDEQAEAVVFDALEAGYRLIDTAENYRNEVGVGRGIAQAGLDRSKVFVTTKFNKRWHSEDGPREACHASLERLGLDYLDLLLIHWPNPAQDRYVEAWTGMLTLFEEGLVRAVGVSNFKPAHLQRLLDETGQSPDVNQIQLSPCTARVEARAFHAEHKIVTQSWSPLGKAGALFREPAVVAAAEAHGKTPAQAVLRWHLQHGLVAIPKSADPARLRQNLEVFDFELSADQMSALDALDQGEDAAEDSDAFGH